MRFGNSLLLPINLFRASNSHDLSLYSTITKGKRYKIFFFLAIFEKLQAKPLIVTAGQSEKRYDRVINLLFVFVDLF